MEVEIRWKFRKYIENQIITLQMSALDSANIVGKKAKSRREEQTFKTVHEKIRIEGRVTHKHNKVNKGTF